VQQRLIPVEELGRGRVRRAHVQPAKWLDLRRSHTSEDTKTLGGASGRGRWSGD
jgi:hypothetical protein